MPELRVTQNGKESIIEFTGTPLLANVLAAGGFAAEHPCGGRGKCGKCAVQLSGAVSEMNEAERRAGVRLSCQAVLLGDARVILPDLPVDEQIQLSAPLRMEGRSPMPGYIGAAVDIGTTTIALQVYDLQTGACIAAGGMRNPQVSVAADVMGRIGAALENGPEDMQAQVHEALNALLRRTGAPMPDSMVIAGNTTMLYLFCGRSPESLSHAPFEADCLFDEHAEFCGAQAYLPPCMNAFVGADISCAVLASGMTERDATSLLIDIGTNGEIALWKGGRLYVTSTAAGPAFEGAGISCGCGSERGAIDRAWIENGSVIMHTIGDTPAAGICGSGLIDLIACLLETGDIEETGAMDSGELSLMDGISLKRSDVCAVQLAKAAIAAGIETLLETAGVSVDEIDTLYIAGGFGSHLNVHSAARIGLIPEELQHRVCVLGNAALAGVSQLLLDKSAAHRLRGIAENSVHLNLGGNPAFNDHYIDQMLFPED